MILAVTKDSAHLAFFAALMLILVVMHGFVWRRLCHDPKWPQTWSKPLAIVFLLAGLGILPALSLWRSLPSPYGSFLQIAVSTWLGLLFITFVILVLRDLLRLPLLLLRPPPHDPARRLFLERSGASAAAVLSLGSCSVAATQALGDWRITEVTLNPDVLGPAAEGLRLVQISDLHIGPMLGRAWAAELVERVNSLKPDLICITGDMVDGSVDELRQEVAPLAGLQARHGIFLCLGNHDHYSGAEEWIAHWQSLGFRVLRNQSFQIDLPHGRLRLAGLDDESGRPDVTATFAEAANSEPCLIMAHQPRAIHRLQERRGLVLSGHTHAGQIWPFGYVVLLVQPYLEGLHEHKSGLWIHVSPGTGFWGPPLRLGSRCEITLIHA